MLKSIWIGMHTLLGKLRGDQKNFIDSELIDSKSCTTGNLVVTSLK